MSLFGFVKDIGRRLFNKDAFQKCVLMAGNVEGVADVYASGLQAYVDPAAAAAAAAAAAEPEEVYYVIQKGDTLWAIAKKFLGSGNRYPEIFEANREVIIDPDKIFPGQKIRIPPK